MKRLSYRELQRRLKILETVVGDIDRGAKKADLQKAYDRILKERPGIDLLLHLNKTPQDADGLEPDHDIEIESDGEIIAPEQEAIAIAEKPCKVCGGTMDLADNWWHCRDCKNKEFNY